jgi:hypothetical protein
MDSNADSLLTLQHGSSKRPIYMDVKMNELSLWRSVLAQAFKDYISYDPALTSFKKYQETFVLFAYMLVMIHSLYMRSF